MKGFATLESPTATAARSAVRSSRSGPIQAKLTVGPTDDAFEHEADHAAERVVRGGPVPSIALDATQAAQRIPLGRARKDPDDYHKRVQRMALKEAHKDSEEDHKHVQKSAAVEGHAPAGARPVPDHLESQIEAMSKGGEPLSRAERAHYGARFGGYDFSQVRLHSEDKAAQTAAALDARAFTVGQHIFFGSGEHRPHTPEGRRLVAHELAHTIQQSPRHARATRRVQRWPLDAAKDWALGKIRGWAGDFPGYTLFTELLGWDPITGQPVQVAGMEILHHALALFFPDSGEQIFQNIQQTAHEFLTYFQAQWTQLNITWTSIKALFERAWDAAVPGILTSPSDSWEKIKALFSEPIGRTKTFVVNVGGYILRAIKKKVLEWLRNWALKQRGYPLLTFIMGKDVFTDQAVQRTATSFIKAVLNLVDDGDKIFDNLQKSRMIEKTGAWLEKEITRLDLSWAKIKALFSLAWDVIAITDLLNPLGFVSKVVEIFAPPVKRVFTFVVDVGKKFLEFVFEGAMILAGPTGMRIVAIFNKISSTFSTIVANPVAFLGHLLDAVKLGFTQFVAKIDKYLKDGVIDWMVGTLSKAGVTLPKVWDLKGILSLVLQILGITYPKMRAKMVKVLGEKAVQGIENVYVFVVALVHDGPAAAWEKITEAMGSFRDMVLGGVEDWAITKIIKIAVAQLVALFNPVGAVIGAIVETYRTVSYFIERINQILDLVEAIVNSIANIAAGNIAAAANYVEKTLAKAIPVMIGFLASLIGLGDISDGIKKVIEKIQMTVDKAIDKAIAWIVAQAKKLFGVGDKDEKSHDDKWKAGVEGLKADIEQLDAADKLDSDSLDAKVPEWKKEYGFTELEVKPNDAEESWDILGAMSAKEKAATAKSRTFSGDSESTAIPITWYKMEDDFKPITITVGNETKTINAFDSPVTRMDPRTGFSGNTVRLGVTAANRIKTGKTLKRRFGTDDFRSTGVENFNAILKDFAFDVKAQGLTVDHVKDIGFGGDDSTYNLWPLTYEKNVKNALVYYNQYKIKYWNHSKHKAQTTNLNHADLDGKWFKITGTISGLPQEVGGHK